MKPARFEYFRPQTLPEALRLMNEHGGDARVLAGGQSLVPMMNLRIAKPPILIDLNAVDELVGIRRNDHSIHIGAMTRQASLLTDENIKKSVPLLAAAAHHIGHVQTRSRGTIGGSIAHADASAEIALVMVTLGASFTLRSASGERRVPAREFFVEAMTTALRDGELLTTIEVPVSPPGTKTVFREFARRHGDFAIASVAVQRTPDNGDFFAGVGAVGPVPHFCANLCKAMAGQGIALTNTRHLIDSEISNIDPINDLNASGQYRHTLAKALLSDCIQEVFAP